MNNKIIDNIELTFKQINVRNNDKFKLELEDKQYIINNFKY